MRNFLFFLFLFPQLHFSQEIKAVPLSENALTADRFVGVDDYKNLYTITERVLYKKTAERTYQFSDLQLGQMSSADLINPLRITVFYDQFNTAVILDNRLNEITRINFNQQENFRNVSFARTASDRRLWIFNVDLQRLELFDLQNNRMVSLSPPLSTIASAMTSNFNRCYIYTGKDLKIYNNYGSLIDSIPVEGLQQLHQDNEVLVALRHGKPIRITGDKMDSIKIPLDEKQVKQLYYANEILYIYDGTILRTYSLKLPKN